MLFATRSGCSLISALALASALLAAEILSTEIWRMEDVRKIGGHATEVVGAPRLVDAAVVFDGNQDWLFLTVWVCGGAGGFRCEAGTEGAAERAAHLGARVYSGAGWKRR